MALSRNRIHPRRHRYRYEHRHCDQRRRAAHLPSADYDHRPAGRTRRRGRRTVCPTMGNRDRIRRAENPPARTKGGPTIENLRRSPPRSLRASLRALRHQICNAFHSRPFRTRSRQDFLLPDPAGRSPQHDEPPGFFPLTPTPTPTAASQQKSSANYCPSEPTEQIPASSNGKCPYFTSNTHTTEAHHASTTDPVSSLRSPYRRRK